MISGTDFPATGNGDNRQAFIHALNRAFLEQNLSLQNRAPKALRGWSRGLEKGCPLPADYEVWERRKLPIGVRAETQLQTHLWHFIGPQVASDWQINVILSM